jgi:hypothetical protein
MGYFDGLTEAAFKKDGNGNTVFYPWGVLGKGRVLTDPARAERLRAFVRRYYQVTLPIIIVVGVVRIWSLLAVVVAALVAWFIIRSRQLLAGTAVSDERLTLKEGYRNSAARHNKLTLWVLFILSGLFAAAGIWIARNSYGPRQVAVGAGTAFFFALCGLAIGYMLHTRRA